MFACEEQVPVVEALDEASAAFEVQGQARGTISLPLSSRRLPSAFPWEQARGYY